MKTAVVGSGISGIVSAYLLDSEHDVTLFEDRNRLGGHSHTVDVTMNGRTEPVDTGFIVYNEKNYPLFSDFLDELGVESRPSSMSFSFSDENGEYEYSGHGIKSIFPDFESVFQGSRWAMLRDIISFYRSAQTDADSSDYSVSIQDYLTKKSYSNSFVDHHLLPMISAIWSVSIETAKQYPFTYVVDFFERHGLLKLWDRPQWHTIKNGSIEYIKAFKRRFEGEIRTREPVDSIGRTGEAVTLHSDTGSYDFESVVLATHSDQSLKILESPSDTEREILSSIQYASNKVTLHTDESLLPSDKDLWSSWNYHISGHTSGNPTVTYCLSILQDLDFEDPLCLTLNSDERIDSRTITDQFEYSHPVFTSQALRARERRSEINGEGNVYYAGAYWGDGFHESGVKSAVDTVNCMGVNW